MLIKQLKVKPFRAIKNKRLYFALVFISIGVVFSSIGCGKRKPPRPPVERIAQRVEINGMQIGNRVNLTWQMPARNASDGSTLNIQRADIYRLAEPITDPLSLNEDEFVARSTLIVSIPIQDTDFELKTKTFSDELRFAGQKARLRYAVRFVNSSGQKAGFSNFFLIEPTANIASSPQSLELELSQTAISLTWKAPTSNVNSTTPVNILGYNLYRMSRGADSPRKLNEESRITETRYDDSFFKFGDTYKYFVRTVSLGGDGLPVESTASNTVEVTPKDTFAPAAPDSITIAAAPGNISIFFATNLEKDVIGYKLYRSTKPNLPKAQWSLLTPQILTTNTYQDTKVVSAVVYYYYLTAIDNAGNVSATSEAVSETAF